MVKIKLASKLDYAYLQTLYGRCSLSNNFLIKISDLNLKSDLENNCLYLLAESSKVIGCICLSRNIELELEFKSKKELYNFLDDNNLFDDEIFIIKYILIDPMYLNLDHEKMLLDYIFSTYKKASFIIKNPAKTIYFIQNYNFISDKNKLLIRKYTDAGLCKNIKW